ncbi:hypothetical protein [Nocardioides caldifontis]|uniref:hypothetical protein n=1 Tax=Nocardioides caldifontis TaxID=2588938 RepID=UPI0011DFEF4B|nr:hypothetical protein [Nocardioides caldifontis]
MNVSPTVSRHYAAVDGIWFLDRTTGEPVAQDAPRAPGVKTGHRLVSSTLGTLARSVSGGRAT